MGDGFPLRNVRTQTLNRKVKLNSSTANAEASKNLIIQFNILAVWSYFMASGQNVFCDHTIIDQNNSIRSNWNLFTTVFKYIITTNNNYTEMDTQYFVNISF